MGEKRVARTAALRPACVNASARRQKALGRRAEGRPKAFGLPASRRFG
jgi:hypothetical protein